MSHELTAQVTTYIHVDFTGTYVPGEDGGRDNPSFDSGVEDLAISGLTTKVAVGYHPPTPGETFARQRWKTVDLLLGVDTTAPEVQRLLENLCAVLETDAVEELSENASE